MIRVPRSLKECRSDVTAATSDLTQELGRAPEPSEVAERIGVPVRLVVDSLEARQAYRCASLDSPRSTDDSALGDRIGRPDHGYDAVLDQSAVAQLLDTLPARERRIVVLRFFGNLTQSEIARRLDISQMHVSRLLRDALASLRAELDSAAGQAHRGRRGHAVGSPCCCAQQYPAQPPTNAA
jgi:RNA polymerase sigma-B factor